MEVSLLFVWGQDPIPTWINLLVAKTSHTKLLQPLTGFKITPGSISGSKPSQQAFSNCSIGDKTFLLSGSLLFWHSCFFERPVLLSNSISWWVACSFMLVDFSNAKLLPLIGGI